MAHLYRLILACLVYLVCLPLFAQITPTPGQTEYTFGYGVFNTSKAAACTGRDAVDDSIYGAAYDPGRDDCCYTLSWGAPGCAGGWSSRNSPPTCPANSTLSGSFCVCNSGYNQEGQTCVNPQESVCAALSGQSIYVQVPGRVLPGATVCGNTGCLMTVSGTVIIGKQNGNTVTEGDAAFAGGTCNPNDSPAPAAQPDDCPNGASGQVNGVTVCVPYNGQNDVESIKTEQQESSDSESGQEQKNTTKQTVCTGNTCTTTTTTTTVVNGGTPRTTTSEKTEAKDDFCTANPKSPQCSSSSFAGSCGSFSCSGDAVQCAIAREQHTRNCQMFSATNQETQQYETAKAETGNRTDVVPTTPVAISPASFDQTPVFGAGACIADLQVTVWGSQLALPLSTICPQLEWLRALLLTISFLLAVRIVSRG